MRGRSPQRSPAGWLHPRLPPPMASLLAAPARRDPRRQRARVGVAGDDVGRRTNPRANGSAGRARRGHDRGLRVARFSRRRVGRRLPPRRLRAHCRCPRPARVRVKRRGSSFGTPIRFTSPSPRGCGPLPISRRVRRWWPWWAFRVRRIAGGRAKLASPRCCRSPTWYTTCCGKSPTSRACCA